MSIAVRLWVSDWEGCPTPYREMVVAKAVPMIYEPIVPKRSMMFSAVALSNSPTLKRRGFELQRCDECAESLDYIAWRGPE